MRPQPNARRQRGATALFVTLIVLLVVMLLGVTAAFLAGTQVKLAGNLQLEHAAFNLAEGSVSSAQAWLNSGTNFSNTGFNARSGSTPPELYPKDALSINQADTTNPLNSAFTWDNTTSRQVVSGDESQRYVIEMLNVFGQPMWSFGTDLTAGSHRLGPCKRANVYRITARGLTAKNTVKFVQTAFSVKVDCIT